MSTNLITCEHCRSEIPRGANVCRGCHAEIKYGPRPLFLWLSFLGPFAAGFFLCKFLHTYLSIGDSALYILWGAITLVGFAVLLKSCFKAFSGDVRFIREQKH